MWSPPGSRNQIPRKQLTYFFPFTAFSVFLKMDIKKKRFLSHTIHKTQLMIYLSAPRQPGLISPVGELYKWTFTIGIVLRW